MPVPVDVDVEDSEAPDLTEEPDVEEAEDEDLPEQDVLDGVIDPDPDPGAALPVVVVVPALVLVVVPVTGGILIGTLADEHTEVTASETED